MFLGDLVLSSLLVPSPFEMVAPSFVTSFSNVATLGALIDTFAQLAIYASFFGGLVQAVSLTFVEMLFPMANSSSIVASTNIP